MTKSLTKDLKKINIKIITDEERCHPSYGGEYLWKGKRFFLTNSQADTILIINKLISKEDRFNFFCLAYLRQIGFPFFTNKIISKKYKELKEKFGMPWSGRVRNVLPPFEFPWDINIAHKKGLNVERLKAKYNLFSELKFTIYCPKEKKFEMKKYPLDEKGDQDVYWNFDIGNYKIYGTTLDIRGPLFALSPYASLKTKRNLMAASKAISMGIESIDYVLRRYGCWNFNDDIDVQREQLVKIITDLKNELSRFALKWSSYKSNCESSLGLVAADAALTRCQSAFWSIFCLTGRGYYVESMILARHIIEQVAWATSIYKMTDIKDIEKKQPQECIGSLKKVYPPAEEVVGRLYGKLSSFAHLSAENRQEYLSRENNLLWIVNRSIKDSLRLLPELILTLDIYISVFEYLRLDNIESDLWIYHKNCEKPNLNPKRNLILILKKFYSTFKKANN